jgi:deoxyadenosine/deoxycytidine kinase
MNNTSNCCGSQLKKNRVVEIIGPAGAGKTTLCQALDHHSELFRLENFPDVRKVTAAPFYISNGLHLIPSLLRLYKSSSRQLTRREFAWMAILNGWPTVLRKESSDGDKVIILDQGPLYLLAEMRLFGPDYLRQENAKRFWQNLYDRWKAILYMVVWLDTADDVLLDRIRTRQQEHVVKNQPATVAYEFLGRYRSEYESILSALTAQKVDLKVFQYNTEQLSSQDIADQLVNEFSCRKKII